MDDLIFTFLNAFWFIFMGIIVRAWYRSSPILVDGNRLWAIFIMGLTAIVSQDAVWHGFSGYNLALGCYCLLLGVGTVVMSKRFRERSLTFGFVRYSRLVDATRSALRNKGIEFEERVDKIAFADNSGEVFVRFGGRR